MLFKTPTARLSGRVRYTFLDENNQPTFAHDQHGREIWGGHWNSNLITDTGLDAVATDRLRSYPSGAGNIAQSWRAYGHVGTGSTTPANTDTVLDAEVMTSSSDGGFADENSYDSPTGGFITANYQITRLFTMASAQNLTEYGFSNDQGSLHIRELFRDDSDNPITVSIAGGKKLRLDHTLTITLPWAVTSEAFDIEEYDVNDALTATHAMVADCTFFGTSSSVYSALFYTALPVLGSASATKYIRYSETAPASSAPDQPWNLLNDVDREDLINDTYTPGSFTIRQYAIFEENQAVGSLVGYSAGVLNGASAHGFKVLFTTPATFTKADTHTLELAIELSWARG